MEHGPTRLETPQAIFSASVLLSIRRRPLQHAPHLPTTKPNFMFRKATTHSLLFQSFLLLALLSPLLLGAQQAKIGYPKPNNMVPPVTGDTLVVRVQNLPAMQALQGVNVPSPRYSYLWIFDDGNFLNEGADSTVNHYYSAANGAQDHYPMAYITGLYGGGNPPPKMAVPDSPIKPAPTALQPVAKTSAVKPGALIHLQKNHQNLVPNDTTVWILSIKNPLQQISLSGQVYLFYDGIIEVARDTLTYVPASLNGQSQYGAFTLETTHVFKNEVLAPALKMDSIPVGTLRDQYRKAAIWSYNNLAPGEERHFFVRMKNDPNLLGKFPEEQLGRVKFMAVMTSFENDNAIDIQLADGEAKLASRIGLSELFGQQVEYLQTIMSPWFNNPSTVNNLAFGNKIIDLIVAPSALAAAHDPNALEILACNCPPQANAAQELLFKVKFSNDGNAPATQVNVQIQLPADIDANEVEAQLTSVYPDISNANITRRILPGNTVEWELKNVYFQSSKTLGEDHPATYGQIVFKALTKAGTDVNTIAGMQACISFNGGGKVCTALATPQPQVVAGSTNGEILSCKDDCKLQTGNGGFDWCKIVLGMPLWLLLVLLLLLLIVVIWLIYRRNA